MADFCTNCTKKLFDDNTEPDIDVQKIFDSLSDGYMYVHLLCEGCCLVAIRRDSNKIIGIYKEISTGELSESEYIIN